MAFNIEMNGGENKPLKYRITIGIFRDMKRLFRGKYFPMMAIFFIVILCWNGNADDISAAGAPPTKTNDKVANEKAAPPMILVNESMDDEKYKDKGIVYMGCAIFEKGAWRNCPEDSPPTGYDTVSFTYMDIQTDFFRTLCRLDNPDHFFMEDTFYLLFKKTSSKECWPAAAIISKPAWSSPLKKAVNPPSVEELFDRMQAVLQPLEEYEKKYTDSDTYDPAKLLPPEIATALEFEIAPGEGAYFMVLQRKFPAECAYPDCPNFPYCCDENASYWAALLRKDGLDTLWSWGWVNDPFMKKTINYQLMGVADINGDGITDILLFWQGYECFGYTLYGYKDKHLFTQLDVGFGGY